MKHRKQGSKILFRRPFLISDSITANMEIKELLKKNGLKVDKSWKHEVKGYEKPGRASVCNISVQDDGSWTYGDFRKLQAWLTITGKPGGGYSDTAFRASGLIRPTTKEKVFLVVPSSPMDAKEFFSRVVKLPDYLNGLNQTHES